MEALETYQTPLSRSAIYCILIVIVFNPWNSRYASKEMSYLFSSAASDMEVKATL